MILTHEKKLNKLRLQQHSSPSKTVPFAYPKNLVQNYSKYNLTDEEIEALSKGLDFVLSLKKLDDQTIIAIVETSFVSLLGYAMDQRDYETKDKDEPTRYKLTSEQLLFANKIRRIHITPHGF